MEFYVLKVKGKELFYNADEVEGDIISSVPILLSEDEAKVFMILVIDMDIHIFVKKMVKNIAQKN